MKHKKFMVVIFFLWVTLRASSDVSVVGSSDSGRESPPGLLGYSIARYNILVDALERDLVSFFEEEAAKIEATSQEVKISTDVPRPWRPTCVSDQGLPELDRKSEIKSINSVENLLEVVSIEDLTLDPKLMYKSLNSIFIPIDFDDQTPIEDYHDKFRLLCQQVSDMFQNNARWLKNQHPRALKFDSDIRALLARLVNLKKSYHLPVDDRSLLSVLDLDSERGLVFLERQGVISELGRRSAVSGQEESDQEVSGVISRGSLRLVLPRALSYKTLESLPVDTESHRSLGDVSGSDVSVGIASRVSLGAADSGISSGTSDSNSDTNS